MTVHVHVISELHLFALCTAECRSVSAYSLSVVFSVSSVFDVEC